jgi:hypothetical protein
MGAWIAPAGAAPTTVTFEALPETPFNSYTEGLVTFTAVNGGLLKRDVTPDGTWGLRAVVAPYPEQRADIAGGASFVSVELGDFAGIDAETVFLEIFDAEGNSLGFTSQAIPADLMGMTTLSLTSPCFAYAIFGSRDSTSNNGSSVRSDNFTFEPCACPSAIPAPGAILLGTMGASIVGYLRRRRAL